MTRKPLAGVVCLSVAFAFAGTTAATAAPPPSQSAAVDSTATEFSAEDYEALLDALDSVPEGASAAEAAAILFPEDLVAQREYLRHAAQVEAAASGAQDGDVSVQAVPAVLVPYLVVIGRCVAGAIGGAGVAEVINYVRNGQQASAEARVDAAVGGCITSVVPPFLRSAANAAKPYIVNAIVAIIIRWG